MISSGDIVWCIGYKDDFFKVARIEIHGREKSYVIHRLTDNFETVVHEQWIRVDIERTREERINKILK